MPLAIFPLALLAMLPLRAAPPLQQCYLNIYLAINEGSQFEQAKDYLNALVRYEVAESFLEKIHATAADWETALVTHRIADCKARVAALMPFAAKQLAGQNNVWNLDRNTLQAQGDWPALERAQSKATFLEAMRAEHPELGKDGFSGEIHDATKQVDDLENGLLHPTA